MDALGQVFIAVKMSSGFVIHCAFQTRGRGFRSRFEGWSEPDESGWQTRADSDANIEFYVAQTEREMWSKDGHTVVSWRRISDAEHALFERDRPYRNALVDNAGRIEYDMSRARERHRLQLRRERTAAMIDLDARFMRALGQGNKAEQDAVEAERQKWRDVPADPRIEAAQTLEELKQIRVV